ncbi:ABC transporter substrate-binding protein [Pyrofollis japonicus]|uniref:ABC transporter substrate-binding protein n=1 Tax=Pyrofollis japonicus TaxID=3060460 RepID=UPI00295AFAC9|nr:ABC transporter substrate-binding protein [Pyrofollis japonicus]BEP17303.1 ABC transporter substrate-binding protein [Pyrofollis japonicus]
MVDESKRNTLKVLGAGVVGLVVGLAGGYAIGASSKKGATKTVTVTKEVGGGAAAKPSGIPSKPLKIGFMYFMSGPFGTYGKMAGAALEIARDEINSRGGILGRKVELISKDEADRQHVIDNIVKMVQEEGAEILIGIDSSGDSLKLIKTIEEELRVPLIVTHAATPKLTECGKRKYIFRISMYEEPIDIAAAELVAKMYPDAKKVASIGPDYAYGWDSWTVFSSRLKELMPGVEFAEPIYVKLGTTDYTSYIDKMIAAKPDIVFSSLWGGDAATFFKQAASKGLFKNIKAYLNPMLGATDTLKAIGDENVPSGVDIWGSGRYWFNYPPHDVYSLNKSFVEKFKAKTGEYPPYVSGTSYTALYAVKNAIELAYAELGKWPSPEELIKYLEGLTVAGPMGPVYIRPEDHQGVYYVYWGKLAKGGPLGFPHPVLTDLEIFDFGKVVPPPFKTYVKCG